MSYTPSATPQNYQEQPKDNRNLIYGILVGALLLTWGYMIYDKSQTKEQVAQKDAQIVNVSSAKDSIQQEYNLASAKLDSMAGTNVKLEGALAEKNSDIIKLKQNINGILKKKNATDAELKQAKGMIAELNGKIDNLFADLEKAKAENQQLTATNTQLNTDKQQLSAEKQAIADNLAATDAAKKNVEDLASTLHASNISIAAINVKNNGKEKETSTAKRADLLRFSFDLDENRVAPSGIKQIYIAVVGPDGKAISNGTSFTTRDAGDKLYTEKVEVTYEQGKRKNVSFDWKQKDANYQVGDYKIQIYHNGFKIGEGTKTLKKGGLFS
jgi:myosin heavy subunit